MEELRPSSSYGDGRMEMEAHGSRVAPASSAYNDFRSYSTSSYDQNNQAKKETKLKKGKSISGGSHSSSSNKGGWSLSDPELKRKKRVAGYKVYSVEGKMKGSLRKSFGWLKDRCTQMVHGHW